MTAPGRPALQRARDWADDLAATLDDVTRQVENAARRLARAWPDEHGEEWVERILLLRRDLDRHADVAADLGRTIDRIADTVDDASGPPIPLPLGRSPGPRLGGTGGTRADDERGVRIPQLGDDGDTG